MKIPDKNKAHRTAGENTKNQVDSILRPFLNPLKWLDELHSHFSKKRSKDNLRKEEASIICACSVRTLDHYREIYPDFPKAFRLPKCGNTLFFNKSQILRWRKAHG